MSWWPNWAFVAIFGNIAKKNDDVIEWRHYIKNFWNFCENVFQPKACTTDKMERFTWLNVKNRWDGASDTRRQNGWQNNDLLAQNHDIGPKTSPSPPISMLNDRFLIPDSERGLHASTLKKGERGDSVKGPLCGVLRFVPVSSKNSTLFWVLPRYFVVGCLRRHPINFWHSVI